LSVSNRDDQFRNRLCERIGHLVVATEFHVGDCIMFRFDDGGTVEQVRRDALLAFRKTFGVEVPWEKPGRS
jgi:hypothetical protein